MGLIYLYLADGNISSETVLLIYQNTRHHIQEEPKLRILIT